MDGGRRTGQARELQTADDASVAKHEAGDRLLYDISLQEVLRMARVVRATPRRKSLPLSVPVSPEIRARLDRYAKRTGVPLATGFRMLAVARLDELEEQGQLTRAQEWQRARSWAIAQTIVDGTAREGSLEDLTRGHAATLRRARARASRAG